MSGPRRGKQGEAWVCGHASAGGSWLRTITSPAFVGITMALTFFLPGRWRRTSFPAVVSFTLLRVLNCHHFLPVTQILPGENFFFLFFFQSAVRSITIQVLKCWFGACCCGCCCGLCCCGDPQQQQQTETAGRVNFRVL